MTIFSFVQTGLGCHHFVGEPAASPSGAIVSAIRMRFCQADDTRRTPVARFDDRNPAVLSISQKEVARFLGLSRQAVNQYLQNWKVQGWLALGRGKIVIVDEHALRDVVAAHSPLNDNFAP